MDQNNGKEKDQQPDAEHAQLITKLPLFLPDCAVGVELRSQGVSTVWHNGQNQKMNYFVILAW
jgi:hypothetical protein